MSDGDANNATTADLDNLASRIEGRFDGLATTIAVAVEPALKPVRESIGNLETKVDALNKKVGSLDARMAKRSMEIPSPRENDERPSGTDRRGSQLDDTAQRRRCD